MNGIGKNALMTNQVNKTKKTIPFYSSDQVALCCICIILQINMSYFFMKVFLQNKMIN